MPKGMVLVLFCELARTRLVPAADVPLPSSAVAEKVVVLKSERKLMLMKNDKLLKTYRIALGTDPGAMACAHCASSDASISQPGSLRGRVPLANTTLKFADGNPNCLENFAKSFAAPGSSKASTMAMEPEPPLGTVVTTFGSQPRRPRHQLVDTREGGWCFEIVSAEGRSECDCSGRCWGSTSGSEHLDICVSAHANITLSLDTRYGCGCLAAAQGELAPRRDRLRRTTARSRSMPETSGKLLPRRHQMKHSGFDLLLVRDTVEIH